MKRVVILVLDSVGMGALPDADKYGDEGSNTLGNIAEAIEGFQLPNLQKLGLGNINGMKGISRVENPVGCFGSMAERSPGKDTTTGHWEIAGIILDRPFPVYPHGFPEELIQEFEKAINTKVLGNKTASGTEIIKELGQQHVMTGYPIVYTSADSVFQIAAHEDVIPIEKLYEICRIAREILKGEHAVGRVIARPFTGSAGNFVRTDRRHDFSLKPVARTVLDIAKDSGYDVIGVGKIVDIFAGQGITDSIHTHGNMDGVDRTLEYLRENFNGILFTNLVDFDMLYGHRNDIKGYSKALQEVDARVPEILSTLKEDDILIITADHGCDPTTVSTDHSREYVPLLIYGNKIKKGVNLGIRSTFADIAATVSEILDIQVLDTGKSFYKDVIL